MKTRNTKLFGTLLSLSSSLTKMSKSRNYMFTSFDLTKVPDYLPDGAKYMVYQVELCPETAREHIQGYIELKKPCRMNAVKLLLNDPTVHLEVRRGTQQNAIDYCTKEATRRLPPIHLGAPAKQGERNDITEVVEYMKAGATDLNLLEMNAGVYLKYYRGLRTIRNLLVKEKLKNRTEIEVVVHVGPTGVGKSHRAWTENPDLYKLASYEPIWFDGYEGESCILLDEFTGQLPYEFLLNMLDVWKMMVPYKGGFYHKQWTKVVICSNYRPNTWYPNKSYSMLERRITSIIEMEIPYTFPVLELGQSGTMLAGNTDSQQSVETVPLNQLEWYDDESAIFIESDDEKQVSKRRKCAFIDDEAEECDKC